MLNQINLLNQKFGKLLVVSSAGSKVRQKWNCVCDCGEKYLAQSSYTLISKKTKSCGSCTKKRTKMDLTGKRFGRLTVVQEAGQNRWNITWLCKCECGNEKVIDGSVLKSGESRSCGCLHKERASEANSGIKSNLYVHGDPLRSLFAIMQKDAFRRNHSWNLDLIQFKEIIRGNCNYCNEPPANKLSGSKILRNGIDRVDNTIGYEFENCVSCCKDCNYMKRAMDVKDFIAHCLKISENQKRSI